MAKNAKTLLALALASVVMFTAVVGLVVGIFTHVPDFRPLRSGKVKVPIRLADGEKSTKWIGPTAPGWVPTSQISDDLLMAIVSSEDTAFYSHNGVDLHELKEAIKKDIEEKRWARGASTLTQQVVKNAFLTSEKTLWRKFKEILWARELEKVLTKSQILTFYVNMAEFGPGIYGVSDAARLYFHESASELTPRQSAFLAMLLPSPRRYHSYFKRKHLSPWASGRVNRILQIMNRMGFIDETVYASALQERLWGEPAQTIPAVSDEEPVGENLPSEDAPVTDDEATAVPPETKGETPTATPETEEADPL
jgi:monofunctional biosynthetic peptidoglycan transglycosylase